MRPIIVYLFLLSILSCTRPTGNDLPAYNSEISVEMYLEEGSRLKCLVTESIAYSSTTINQMLHHSEVIFSDGTASDTLRPAEIYDYETGRHHNYASLKRFRGDRSKTYTLTVTDSLGRQVSASTGFSDKKVELADVIFQESSESPNRFSVGLSFADPSGAKNFYRVIIGKGINNYRADHTDFLLSDAAFDGKDYSFSSGADYQRDDTITVRLYSLAEDHYHYLQTAETARTANYNPFMQPVRVKSNIKGGQGIFAAILYDEKSVIIR